MVRKFISILQKEIASIHQAAYLLGVFAFASQILALVRDRLLAGAFGAGETLDIYYAAFRIPDILYVAIASFVSVTVLVPFLSERMARGERTEKIRDFLSSVFTAFAAAIAAVSAVVFFLMPALSFLVAPGFSDAAREEFVLLSRILLLSPILLGFSSLLGSVTQAHRRFFLYASAPVVYNLGIIGGIVFLMPQAGIAGVVFGVIAGAALHALVQAPAAVRTGLFPRIVSRIDFSAVRAVVSLSLPRTLTLSFAHISLIALLALATVMEKGSVAVFSFAFNLQSVPLAIIGVSYSVAAFPTLSRFFANGETARFTAHVFSAARHILFWSLPILVLFIVLRAQIVRTVLGSGAFGWEDTMLTAAALALFSVSLVAQALALLFVRAYYAAGVTKTPLSIGIFSSVLTVVLAYGLARLFGAFDMFRYFIESLLRVEGLSGTGVLMLPLAYSLGMCANAAALYVFFKKDFCARGDAPLERTFRHGFYAAVTAGFAAYHFLQVFDDIFDITTFFGIFLQGLFSGILGIAAAALVLLTLRNEELSEILSALHRKMRKTGILAPDQEEL